MLQRWLVAIVGLPLLLVVLLACPPWATMLLVCAIAGAAAYELMHVAGKNAGVLTGLVVLFAAMQVSWRYLEARTGQPVFGMVSAEAAFRWALVILLFFHAVLRYGSENAVPFATVSAGIVGGIVFPAFYGCILLLRMLEPYGRIYVLAPFFIAFAGDSLAMYFGKWFGKKKMAPHVSPNKTWAGFYGNLLGSVLGMLLLGFIGSRWLGYSANYPMLALVGVCGNLPGQLGDLATSLIKREHDVKDYSHLFLTHGGVLDRFDSTLFIAPVVYFFVINGVI